MRGTIGTHGTRKNFGGNAEYAQRCGATPHSRNITFGTPVTRIVTLTIHSVPQIVTNITTRNKRGMNQLSLMAPMAAVTIIVTNGVSGSNCAGSAVAQQLHYVQA